MLNTDEPTCTAVTGCTWTAGACNDDYAGEYDILFTDLMNGWQMSTVWMTKFTRESSVALDQHLGRHRATYLVGRAGVAVGRIRYLDAYHWIHQLSNIDQVSSVHTNTKTTLLQNDKIHCKSQDCLFMDVYGMLGYIVNPKIVRVLICCEKRNKMEIWMLRIA